MEGETAPERRSRFTIGVDLAAQSTETAACVVDWGTKRNPKVRAVSVQWPADDDYLVDLITKRLPQARVGIDCPFGWPTSFAVQLHRWSTGADWELEYSTKLRLRLTDRLVRRAVKGSKPASVSASWLGATAMHCARLLTKLADSGVEIDRSGTTGRVVEVYPAVARRRWAIVDGYATGSWIPSWLEIEQADRAKITAPREGHCRDALLAALVARAATIGQTRRPSRRQKALANVEGWIHVPCCELAALGEPK